MLKGWGAGGGAVQLTFAKKMHEPSFICQKIEVILQRSSFIFNFLFEVAVIFLKPPILTFRCIIFNGATYDAQFV